LILAVEGADVVDIASFSAKMGEIAVQKPNSVVFKILRGIYTFYVELEPKWESGQ
jgi:hypothetical protein